MCVAGGKGQTALSPLTDSASDLRNALQICSSRRVAGSTLPRASHQQGKGYCFHDHKSGCCSGGQCLLKPSRTLSSQFHPSNARNMRRGFNLSSDLSDTNASSLSLPEATRTLGRYPGSHGYHGNVDKKKPPTVTFQDQKNSHGSTQSLEGPVSKGPMAKFAYIVPTANVNGTHQQKLSDLQPAPQLIQQQHTQPQSQLQQPHQQPSGFYSNHDRLADGQNNNHRSSPTSSCSETVIVKPPSCPLEPHDSPDRTSSFKGCNSRLPVKGILKNADEPIRRCINDNLSKYGSNRTWGRDADAVSDDGTETTISGSYTLDVEDAIEEEDVATDPKAGFSV